jgi:hypothetical protein
MLGDAEETVRLLSIKVVVASGDELFYLPKYSLELDTVI